MTLKQIIYNVCAAMLMTLALPSSNLLSAKTISIPDGLSNDFVETMATDGEGFVWVGTRSGLNRITSYGIITYNCTNSLLPNDYVTALCYDKATNSMIVGTQGGLCMINCATGLSIFMDATCGLEQNNVVDIEPAHGGGAWVLYMSKGLQHLDPKTMRLVPQDARTNKQISRTAHCCLDCADGTIIIGYNGTGMAVVDIRRGTVTNYRHKADDKSSLPSDNVRSIVRDNRGNIFVGTNSGLALFDRKTRIFHRLGQATGLDVGDNIYRLTLTPRGQVLAACNLDGVSLIESGGASKDHTESIKATKVDGGNAACARVALADSYGNIWIGNHGTGVDFNNLFDTPFGIMRIANGHAYTYGIAKSHDGRLWVGSDSDIYLYDGNRQVGCWNFKNALHRSSALALSLYEDSKGNLWIGLDDKGVMVMDAKSRTFRRVEMERRNIDIFGFLELRDGSILIGSELGLYAYRDGKVRFLKAMTEQLPSPTVYTMAYDGKGRLWIGTDGGGTVVFAPSGKVVEKLRKGDGLPSNTVTQIMRAQDGSMFIATSNGLCRMANTDRPNLVKTYGAGSGLTDLNVKALAQDDMGYLWVSTYTNIARLDTKNGTFTIYDFNVGIPAGGYLEGAVPVTKDGVVYFGSTKGVCRINTRLADSMPKVSRVDIVRCETVEAEAQTMTTLTPDEDGVYRLNHDASTIRVEFSVVNYGEQGMVEYSYMMDGLDNKWYLADNDKMVTFRNLIPGKYKFHVRARLRGGKWSDDRMASISIVVSPPWWATWWMNAIYMLLAVAVAMVVLKSYKHKLNLENSLKIRDASLAMERENRKREQDMQEGRLRFYTNIAHELRTPLTLVLGPLDDLRLVSGIPQQFKPKLDMAYNNATRLLKLINRLMEFRKTETGNNELRVERGDMASMVNEVGLRFVEASVSKGINIKIDVPKQPVTMLYDHEVIDHIIDNLMSNAMKYTPAGGNVRLRLTTDGEKATISVADNGYGIDPKALPHIFERYYQENGKHQASGTGIGLAIVKSLAKLHEATIGVESEPGKGTVFTLTLSRKNTYPQAKHVETAKDITAPQATVAKTTTDMGNGKADNDTSKPLLLVAEDNDDIRAYVAGELGDSYRVATARNGREALQMAKDKTPDIVVSDVMMPEMDGMQLCRLLKNDMDTSHVPVVLLTAKTTNDDKEEGYRCGADSYLTKPFSAKLLRTRLENIMKTRQRLARRLAKANVDKAGETAETESCQTMNSLTTIDRHFVEQLNQLIRENMANAELDMAFFTDRMNMSYSSFYRKVKALYDMTPVELLRKMRLSLSAHLLRQGDCSVTEAATKSGFDNMGHFRKCFKDEYGVAPSEYSKQG